MLDSRKGIWPTRVRARLAAACLLVIGCSLAARQLRAQLRSSEPTRHGAQLAQSAESPSDNRFALLVGISDYPGTDNDLGGGPLNDVALMKDVLVRTLGFPEENILTLTDLQATRSNIVKAFGAHLGRAGKDGAAVFYFSGHGSQVPNISDDPEPDGLDEVLVLRGSQTDQISLLVDDDLGTLVSSLETDRVLVLLDNCYSGTGTRGAPRSLHWRDLAGDVSLPTTLKRSTSTMSGPYIAKRITRKSLDLLSREPPLHLTQTDGVPIEPSRHILLTASAESEQSLNVSFITEDGSQVSVGLFTAALYTELSKANLRTTSFTALTSSLQEDAQRAALKMRTGRQTPQVEGTQQGIPVASYLVAQ